MFDRINQGIYWDKFWPLVDGCTPEGPECRGCWRAAYTHRFTDEFTCYAHANESTAKKPCGWPRFNGLVKLRTEKINLPLHTKKRTVWFVLNDLYHESVPAEFIVHAYEVMAEAKQHIFIVCTKRPERIEPVLYGEEGRFYLGGGDYISNIWHMTTAGNQEMADKRIPELLKLRHASRGWPVLGVSIEPMLGPMDIKHLLPHPFNREPHCPWCEDCIGPRLGFDGWKKTREDNHGPFLDWVVLGGESGPGARPMNPNWARKVRDDCQASRVPFLFKQWGEWAPRGWGELEGRDAAIIDYHGKKTVDGEVFMVRVGKKAAGRLLDGREYNELPEVK